MSRNSRSFSEEFVDANRAYLDRSTVYHQSFAGNCMDLPSDRCLNNGLGPNTFDCSGLILRSLSDTLDKSIVKEDIRHVRDMWEAAHQQKAFVISEFAVGALAVFGRYYTVKNEKVLAPAHIGVVTDLDDEISIIHANLREGRVREESPKNQRIVLGCIAVNLAHFD